MEHLGNKQLAVYIWREGQTYGPFTAEAVQSYLAQGVFRGDDSAFMEGMANWLPLAQVLSALNQVPTPPVTTPIPPPKKRTTPENGPTSASTPWAKKKKPKAARKPSTTAEPRKPSGKLLTGGLAIIFLGIIGYYIWHWAGETQAVDYGTLSFREGRAFAPGESTPFSGLARELHKNGQVRMESNFSDGREQGHKRTWYEDGALAYEGTMKEGKPDGTATSWYSNGQKEAEYRYKNGEETSRQEWTQDGNPVR